MTFLTNWEDFEKAAERLYLQDPMKVSDVQIIYHASTPVYSYEIAYWYPQIICLNHIDRWFFAFIRNIA